MKGASLVKRFEMLCTPSDYRRWKRRAKQLGFPSVATFVRIAANREADRDLPAQKEGA